MSGLCTAKDLGLERECCCCGGYIADPVPGSVPALIYCSVECHDEWEDFLASEDERRQRAREAEDAESDRLAAEWVAQQQRGVVDGYTPEVTP